MPAAAEIALLGRLLDDVEQEREVVHALHEGIVVGLAEARADIHQVLRRQFLVADRDHLVVEERLVDLSPVVIVHGAQVDTGHLRAQRAGDRRHGDAVAGHGGS